MAAQKRFHEGVINSSERPKRLRADESDENLDKFLTWCKSEGVILNEKVTVSQIGSCAQYGMIATDDIEIGTTLFAIPRSMLLSCETSGIAKLLQEESNSVKSESGWIPLLLSLMHEFTNENSRWRHYLHLVPDFDELDLPMFWNVDDLECKLKGTGVCEAVKRDLSSMKLEFESVVLPFVKSHTSFFKPICEDFEFYKKMVAFVMAYSFTEPDDDENYDSDDEEDSSKTRIKKLPLMVPVADILNHVALNNAHLDFGKDCLKMVATKPIKKGDEVFNTYGELANWQLLHMYGFAEAFPANVYDSVDLPMDKVYAAITEGMGNSARELAERKWRFLQSVGCVTDDGAYVLGIQGVLTEDEMYQMLKVMAMDENAFQLHQEKEGWSDAEEDDDNSESLSFESIGALPLLWREMLHKIASCLLNEYGSTLTEEVEKIKNSFQLTRRQQFSSYVRCGQMKLLDMLLTACLGTKDN